MSAYSKEELENMLEDVINELDLSDEVIEKHGPLATPPAELVKLVLREKDFKISALQAGLKEIKPVSGFDRSQIYIKAVEKWGRRAQYEMAQEEFSEASLAVRKFYRKGGEDAFHHLAEELADAKIMIEQIEMMNPTIGLLIDEFILKKVARLEKRIIADDFEKK